MDFDCDTLCVHNLFRALNPSTLVADYDFSLPDELIASRPLAKRDDSRMMVIDRKSGKLSHRMFRDLPSYFRPGDLAVLNDSKVLKARLHSDDGRIEILLLEPVEDSTWICLVRPGRKMRVGSSCEVAGTRATVSKVLPDGTRQIAFRSPPDLDRYGEMPIPPYFHREADASDDERYQTVYAHRPGSVAAPTAGLHFTPEILERLPHTTLTLHVGIGTFQPVKVDRIADHRMHDEPYTISPAAAEAIAAATRLFAIGTTSTRVLESQPPGPIRPHSGRTNIFLHPPYKPQRVDALFTNFHLPKSTLLMLVCAFAGHEATFAAYAEAIKERYRFFSYGDCMLIL